ncbi:SGNH/GDSL hydrolase family protein [Massilia sp. IC2-476]|uniref:SGNH/GDSL hydrolase family protein n=1 Tax=Massilia sp. IC2-476 TaxID=2887199 RepID=UPI001D10511F|nr:SGNH/GDSL hydrolase family protein [Massilia sp. IC2-476]MCC2971571.1 SGNH/GDSL hydrolase family protein [Massilia sp. IC2-476]
MARQTIPARALALAILPGLLAACGTVGSPAIGEHWVASWGTAQLAPESKDALPAADWRDATLRQVLRVSLGGERLRVRFSNSFGSAPLVISGASVALASGPGRATIDPASARELRFGGSASVTIPAGAEYLSDPVLFKHAAGADLAVSMHFTEEPARQTAHPGSRATSFMAKGRRLAEAELPGAVSFARWYQLAGVEVQAAPGAHAVVAIGDSITDGYGVAPDTNLRWTDALALRLRTAGMHSVGVVNAGIGGGRLLRDGLGPNLAARFERDVLARPGVRHAIVLIGVNDFGTQHRNTEDSPAMRRQLLADMQEALRQVTASAQARGVCVIGATITPYGGSEYYHPEKDNEQDRLAYNDWIRRSGTFDGVIDFDAALRDPVRPDRIRKEYDNDGLHPNMAGYRAMAQTVPLEMLSQCRR